MAEQVDPNAGLLMRLIRRHRELIYNMRFDEAASTMDKAQKVAAKERDKRFLSVIGRLAQVQIDNVGGSYLTQN